ncbi:lipopolysaccharide assembly protein LapA domain-containing protein [Sporosarcina cyprini]|uniref:lipopolysaccharide assembly protein LapA domain-containing protein n=1 Tax=Sporosarcina cyprini TaxID=2910523 RepID=UPI001EDECFB2|nr:LapA family protein [Sporosarcina cyprini]MCG3089222.1 LapA family protein [Sporosarcina cyprini]
MKTQWGLIFGIVFAIIIAVFAVVNVNAVEVNYVVGTGHLPLILVILFSALLGAAISSMIAMIKSVSLQRKLNEQLKEMNAKEIQIAMQQNEIAALQKEVPTENDNETI